MVCFIDHIERTNIGVGVINHQNLTVVSKVDAVVVAWVKRYGQYFVPFNDPEDPEVPSDINQCYIKTVNSLVKVRPYIKNINQIKKVEIILKR